jgi:hypothetical protein
MIAPQKPSAQRAKTFAKGGKTHMLSEQAAGPVKSGRTGKIQTPAPGAKRASGGAKTAGHSVSQPAFAGHTAPPRKGR